MKKKIVFLVVALLTSFGAGATVVDRQQAAQQARDFMAKNFRKSSATRSAAQTAKLNSVETGQPLVHAFNVDGGGFVVVAGDNCAPYNYMCPYHNRKDGKGVYIIDGKKVILK